ncbi:MAG: endolytic transglycosylase MltG [Myxococcota bacterium]|nr:endolytic transglycosylase MltG [Myxococcota bacterium]
MIGRLLLLLFILGLGTSVVGSYVFFAALEPARPGADETTELFRIEPGQGLNQVANRLEKAGLIKNARATSLLGRVRGAAGKLHSGEYEVSAGWSTRTILDRLTSGRVKTYEIVIPEGTRASEIAARLEAAGLAEAQAFLEAVMDETIARRLHVEQDSLEGYLYPETYRLPRHMTPEEIARVFVEQFERVWRDLDALAKGHTLSRHEIVTLASIVEKETAAPEERPLIASVFLNRMQKKMRLETDPTVIYGIADFDGNLTRKHLRDRSNPYNTYRIKGLPPGPIASPGIDALRAVLEPADSDFLYFVSRNDGTHQFSKTYREHTNAVREYQLSRSRRNQMRAQANQRSAN